MDMENMIVDPKVKEAEEICDLLHNAANIAEQAIKSDDDASKKALQAAAKVLIENASKRLDESIGTSVADSEDEE